MAGYYLTEGKMTNTLRGDEFSFEKYMAIMGVNILGAMAG